MQFDYRSLNEYLKFLVFAKVSKINKGVDFYSGIAVDPNGKFEASFDSNHRVPAPLHQAIGQYEPRGTNLAEKYIAGILSRGDQGRRLVRWFYCTGEIRWLCHNIPKASEEELKEMMREFEEINTINARTVQKTWTLGELVSSGLRSMHTDYRNVEFADLKDYLTPPCKPEVFARIYARTPRLFSDISSETIDKILKAPSKPNPDWDWQETEGRYFKCRCCSATMRLGRFEYRETYLKGIPILRKCENCRMSNFAYKPLPKSKGEAKQQAVAQNPAPKSSIEMPPGFDESGNAPFVL